jgi:hypothetical protein
MTFATTGNSPVAAAPSTAAISTVASLYSVDHVSSHQDAASTDVPQSPPPQSWAVYILSHVIMCILSVSMWLLRHGGEALVRFCASFFQRKVVDQDPLVKSKLLVLEVVLIMAHAKQAIPFFAVAIATIVGLQHIRRFATEQPRHQSVLRVKANQRPTRVITPSPVWGCIRRCIAGIFTLHRHLTARPLGPLSEEQENFFNVKAAALILVPACAASATLSPYCIAVRARVEAFCISADAMSTALLVPALSFVVVVAVTVLVVVAVQVLRHWSRNSTPSRALVSPCVLDLDVVGQEIDEDKPAFRIAECFHGGHETDGTEDSSSEDDVIGTEDWGILGRPGDLTKQVA